MTTTNLKLLATSDEDLRVIAAHLQDSIVSTKDVAVRIKIPSVPTVSIRKITIGNKIIKNNPMDGKMV